MAELNNPKDSKGVPVLKGESTQILPENQPLLASLQTWRNW